jgi:hypothetical protein
MKDRKSSRTGKAETQKSERPDRGRLARECAKLSPAEEQEIADEGTGKDAAELPEY